MDECAGRFAPGVGDGNLHINVGAPGVDQAGLPLHFVEIVGENLKGDGAVADDRQDVVGKGLIVGDVRLAHQSRVGGEAPDGGIRIELAACSAARPHRRRVSPSGR